MKNEPWFPKRVWQAALFMLALFGPNKWGRYVGKFFVPGCIGFLQESVRFSRAQGLQRRDFDGPKTAQSAYSHYCVNATDMSAAERPARLSTAPDRARFYDPVDCKPARSYARCSLLRRSPEARKCSFGGSRVSLFRQGVNSTQEQRKPLRRL